MNNKEVTIFTNKEELPGFTIRFIWENPLSHSLEEMGIRSRYTKPETCRKYVVISILEAAWCML
jgi:hypothetical protein